ncbi:MAG: DNA polymerase III subunit alpha [Alphaproteobacteria bacterium]|nr:DNA polymerase III subunit alpha [Alphaproteobacteria bacterium]
MPYANFVHLRVHSAYSLSEGALKLGDLVKLCMQHGMPAVAVTDTGNLFGALEFASYAAEAGVQPIIGCLIGLRREDGDRRQGTQPAPDRLVLLVQSQTGWRNLMKLVSRAFLETPTGETPRVAWSDLEGRTDGLIALTAGPVGTVGRLLANGQAPAARAAIERLMALFPGRLYVELMRQGHDDEAAIEGPLLDLAYALDLPIVATNEIFFAEAAKAEAHDALLSIAAGTVLADPERPRKGPEHRFKSAEEMRKLFADLPEACDNTLVIARRCAFMPSKQKPILPAFPTAEGRTEKEELRAQSVAGLDARLAALGVSGDAVKPYRDRLDFELDVITQMGFAGYFLIVADFIQWAKRQDIPVGPGRGSGAGSVVAWSLTITDLDPLRFGLLFERFLNPERVSMPDFDIDFCQDRRDEVIRYVQGKYGQDKVAQIITFGTLQARAALRDVGRVMALPYPVVDRVCKMVPNNPANPVKLKDAVESEPELKRVRETDESVGRMIAIALQLEGLYRHASTHAAGVVIGDRPLDELVPLYRDPRSDMPVTQYNMKWVESAGLVKFDFLGLTTLTVLVRAVALLKKRGIDLDLANLPLDDPKTFQMLARADATGVFQMESSGMRDVLRRLKPDRFEDLIAVVALYRPGPMDNIPSYIKRKHGEEQPDYLHPKLEGILKETHGIMIYQEQVMQIARELSGYSLGGADLLRRAMGKKIKAEMDAQQKAFVDGAVERGVQASKAAEIFEQVAKFAGYGFNKSHAAAYALVAYQTAWMKANYPVEFMAASMTYVMGSTEKLNSFAQELARIGVKLLPTDINKSEPTFSVERIDGDKLAIRYALGAIRNVGMQAMETVMAEREKNGRFKDLGDFARRVDSKAVNKRAVEMLAAAGAFDSLNPNRAQTHKAAEIIVKHAQAAANDRDSTQVSLFGGDAGGAPRGLNLPIEPDWPALEKLKHEFDAIGFYLSAHPLDSYGQSLQRIDVVPSNEVRSRVAGGSARLKLAGIVVSKQERTSAKGNRFAFVQFTDRTGVFEGAVFSEILASKRSLLEAGKALLVVADARPDGEGVRLTVNDLQPLDEAVAHAAQGLRIYLRDEKPLGAISGVIGREKKGRGKIKLMLDAGQSEIEVAIPGGFAIGPQTRAAIKAIPGIVEVRDI